MSLWADKRMLTLDRAILVAGLSSGVGVGEQEALTALGIWLRFHLQGSRMFPGQTWGGLTYGPGRQVLRHLGSQVLWSGSTFTKSLTQELILLAGPPENLYKAIAPLCRAMHVNTNPIMQFQGVHRSYDSFMDSTLHHRSWRRISKPKA